MLISLSCSPKHAVLYIWWLDVCLILNFLVDKHKQKVNSQTYNDQNIFLPVASEEGHKTPLLWTAHIGRDTTWGRNWLSRCRGDPSQARSALSWFNSCFPMGWFSLSPIFSKKWLTKWWWPPLVYNLGHYIGRSLLFGVRCMFSFRP